MYVRETHRKDPRSECRRVDIDSAQSPVLELFALLILNEVERRYDPDHDIWEQEAKHYKSKSLARAGTSDTEDVALPVKRLCAPNLEGIRYDASRFKCSYSYCLRDGEGAGEVSDFVSKNSGLHSAFRAE
jgi:hypothetical protein